MGGTFGKHGSWVVDHSMDDIPLDFMNGGTRHGSIATITAGPHPPPNTSSSTSSCSHTSTFILNPPSHLISSISYLDLQPGLILHLILVLSTSFTTSPSTYFSNLRLNLRPNLPLTLDLIPLPNLTSTSIPPHPRDPPHSSTLTSTSFSTSPSTSFPTSPSTPTFTPPSFSTSPLEPPFPTSPSTPTSTSTSSHLTSTSSLPTSSPRPFLFHLTLTSFHLHSPTSLTSSYLTNPFPTSTLDLLSHLTLHSHLTLDLLSHLTLDLLSHLTLDLHSYLILHSHLTLDLHLNPSSFNLTLDLFSTSTLDLLPQLTLHSHFTPASTSPFEPPPRRDNTPDEYSLVLETAAERKARKRSHWVAYTTMFVMSIGFSIVLSGVWPYLHELEPSLEKGLSVGFACITTVLVFILGNGMYSMLHLFQGMGYLSCFYAMIVSRFIVGISSANVTLCRSLPGWFDNPKGEDSWDCNHCSCTGSGLRRGASLSLPPPFPSGIQTIVTIAIPEPVDTGVDWFVWDKFTAAGWTAALLGLINLILLLPCIFQEYNIAEKERAMMNAGRKDQALRLPKPDYVSLTAILFGFFITLFIYVLLETLAEPFMVDQYGWTDDKAMVVVGIALSGGGFLSIFMFVLSGVLSKKYDERLVMLVVGFVPLMVGTFLFLPWGPGTIPIQVCRNETMNLTTTVDMTTSTTIGTPPASLLEGDLVDTWHFGDINLLETEAGGLTCTPGCPEKQHWCENTPQLPIPQLIVAYIIVILGYPVAQSLGQALFSKILGPKPQGLWMGVLTGVGSFSRIMGPIFVSYVYTNLGTRWTFGILTVSMVLAEVVLMAVFPRLVPMKVPTLEELRGYDGPAASEKH
ncbi:putative major facilitator superfamily domain-containing protein 8 [Penaeus vannamei]|uniref:Putative major facilitator superfamily domain-containing protein 8 n=1 Tax=Penaeus vannamei TaxID=6689 RepID=A0A423SJJ1_PENVA|nr:putative major facilitator superfamily domain-containing protein 8 [Penaeus vannamei]